MRCSGLPTGSSHPVLAHSCEYHLIRATCRQSDIRKENRNTSAEVRGINVQQPACSQLRQSLEGCVTDILQTLPELENAGNIKQIKKCVAYDEDFLSLAQRAWFKGITFSLPGKSPLWRLRTSQCSSAGALRASSYGRHQTCKDMCRYSGNHANSAQRGVQSRPGFQDAASMLTEPNHHLRLPPDMTDWGRSIPLLPIEPIQPCAAPDKIEVAAQPQTQHEESASNASIQGILIPGYLLKSGYPILGLSTR